MRGNSHPVTIEYEVMWRTGLPKIDQQRPQNLATGFSIHRNLADLHDVQHY